MNLSSRTYAEALARKQARDARRRERGYRPPKRAEAGPRKVLKRGKGIKAKPDPKLQAWGRQVRKRDGNQCRWPAGCQTGDTRIDPHHIAERSLRPDLKYVLSNGIALCRTHHEWLPLNREAAIRMGLLSCETYEKARKAA